MWVFALSGTVLLPGPSCENQYVSRDNATETPGEGNKSGELAARGGAPDSLSVSSLNIRLAHTARAFVLLGLLALTGMRGSSSRSSTSSPCARQPAPP